MKWAKTDFTWATFSAAGGERSRGNGKFTELRIAPGDAAITVKRTYGVRARSFMATPSIETVGGRVVNVGASLRR